MKKLYLLMVFVCTAAIASAQEELPNEKKQQDIEALKVAFISKELELTPDEAQKFWPVYNQYSKELKTMVKSDDVNVIERDEKVLNLKKKYQEQFTRVLGQQRMNRIFSAEGKFHQLLIKSLRNQNQRNKANRPLQRRVQ